MVTINIILYYLIPIIILFLSIIIGWNLYKDKAYKSFFNKNKLESTRIRRRDTMAFLGRKVINRLKSLKSRLTRNKLIKLHNLKFKLSKNLIGRIYDSSDTILNENIDPINRVITKLFHFSTIETKNLLKCLIMNTYEKDNIIFNLNDEIYPLIYVQSGCIDLYYCEGDNEKLFRTCSSGEIVYSDIYLLENALNKNNIGKHNIKGIAREMTITFSLSGDSFREVLMKDYNHLIQIIQITLLRLQHVVLNTMLEFFYLPVDKLMKNINIDKINISDLYDNKLSSKISFQSISLIKSCYNNNKTNDITSTINPLLKETIINEFSLLMRSEKIKSLLLDESEFREFNKGDIINKLNDMLSLIYIYSGNVIIYKEELIEGGGDYSEKKHNDKNYIRKEKGSILNVLPILSGIKSSIEICCQEKCILLIINETLLKKIIIKEPYIIGLLAQYICDNLSDFLKAISFGINWELFDAGHSIYYQGHIDNKLYIVLQGRLRSIYEDHEGNTKIIAEYTHKDFVGIIEVLQKIPRQSTVVTIRTTELAILNEELFNFMQYYTSKTMLHVATILSQKMNKIYQTSFKDIPDISSYSTVAIVSSSSSVPIKHFTFELNYALNQIKRSTIVDSSCTSTSQSNPIISTYRYLQLINQLEINDFMVLWLCDNKISKWTKQCILHADLILIVSTFDSCIHVPTKFEIDICKLVDRRHTPQHLILLHNENSYKFPENTAQWLKTRKWISDFHHIRCHPRIFRISNEYLCQYYEEYISHYPSSPPINSDICRLARRITNTAVGLVLGGGGARGYGHIGAIRVLEKYGIPVDMIGGTSIGSFMGALYCSYQDSTYLTRKAIKFASSASSIFRSLLDLTLPFVSFFTGRFFNSIVYNAFKDRNIEDLLLPYFCVSTDLTSHSLKVHTSGPIWRYSRASMTLLNILPPMCDPYNNHLLIDGGYLNILPADIMLQNGVKFVIAIDVSMHTGDCIGDYGDELSGLSVLLNKMNPWSKKSIPSLGEIQNILCFINSDQLLNKIKKLQNILYIQLPVLQYSTLNFGSYNEIIDISYKYVDSLIQEFVTNKSNHIINHFLNISNYSNIPSINNNISIIQKMSPIIENYSFDNNQSFNNKRNAIYRRTSSLVKLESEDIDEHSNHQYFSDNEF